MADYQENQMNYGSATRASVQYDEGLRSYMLGIYNYMALGIAFTAVVTLAVMNVPAFLAFVGQMPWLFFILLIGASMFGPNMILNSRSVATAHVAFWGYAALWGIAMAPMMYVYLNAAPNMVVQAFAITAALFGSMSVIGYTTKKNLSGIGQFAVMAVIGVLIAMVVNWFMQSTMFSLIISGVYVLAISAITAWETQEIKNMYDAGHEGDVATRKSIFGAFLLYGSFISMFVHILNILGIMGDE
ncbi:MAG: Bax inhibitor-1/YccA family protein [Rhizobiaceae bacterium]|nr:Bax inhibitor-1/YccA family protein [Rhizobiaceae bacterium]